MALIPAGQVAAQPRSEVLSLGPESENRKYQHILSVAVSQEARLVRHAALRRGPGYDLSDPWLVSDEADRASSKRLPLVPGIPCQLVGGGVVAYLGPAGSEGSCRVRLQGGAVAVHDRRQLLPLPTRQARQGDWAVAMDLPEHQARLNGMRGLCGLVGQLQGPPPRPGFWVMFEPPELGDPPEVVLIAEANLVSLPTPPAGAPKTPWEARLSGPDGALTGVEVPLALTEESAVEERLLALGDGAAEEDDGSSSGSVALTDDDGDESEPGEGEEAAGGGASGGASGSRSAASSGAATTAAAAAAPLAPGAFVTWDEPRRKGRHIRARVEALLESSEHGNPAVARVLLLEGDNEGGTREIPLHALTPLSEAELSLGAVCSKCGEAEPEAELLICEAFGRSCLGCAHLGCLEPPLAAVPEDDWYCGRCCASRAAGKSSSAPSRPAKRGAAAEATGAPAKAKAKGRGRGTGRGAGTSAASAASTASQAKPKRQGKQNG